MTDTPYLAIGNEELGAPVSEGDQIWKCHQCGAAGNILTFIERFENINRVEALVKLFKLVINPKPKAPKGETK